MVCAIAGGSGAGKTTLAAKLLERLGEVGTHHTIDWYYRDLSHRTPRERAAVNFDHPDSLEVDLFANHLAALASGLDQRAPIYDFSTYTRSSDTRHVSARPVIVVEGLHLLALDTIRPLLDLKVFIEVDGHVRLARRIERDTAERGRSESSVRNQWATTVEPMHRLIVQPSRTFADRVVTVHEDLDLVAEEIVSVLLDQAGPATTLRS